MPTTLPGVNEPWDAWGGEVHAELNDARARVAVLEATTSTLGSRMTAAEIVNASQSATLVDHSAALALHASTLDQHEADLFDLSGTLAAIDARVTAIENEAPGPNVTGWIDVDSFSNGTDDQKIAAARTNALSTGKGLQFTNRTWTVTQQVALWAGAALDVKADPGPNIISSAPYNFRIDASGMSGPWLTVTATSGMVGVYIGNLSFYGGTSARLIHTNPGSFLYGFQMDSITLFGGAGGLGNDSTWFTSTQGYYTGHWQVHSWYQTPISIEGADNKFAWYLNIDSPTPADRAGAGRPNIRLKTEKSWGVGPYSTGRNGWVAARLEGNPDRQLNSIFGGVYEGYKADSPTTQPAIQITGGGWFLDGANIGHVTTAPGMIHETGSAHLILGATGVKFADAALTLPLLYSEAPSTSDVTTVPIGYGFGARRPVPVRQSDGVTTNLSIGNRLP